MVRYGDHAAVSGVSFEIQAGEILAVLGPNGAGKSSTVRCIVGLQRPNGGLVSICGHDAVHDPDRARRAVGYVPEVPRLHEPLTPTEYLRLKARLFGVPEARIDAGIERLLGGFGLLDRRHTPMAGFSKGMLQKVSLGGALLTEPKLLVMDEPLSGLDVESAFTVKELVRAFADRGGAVLYCSHLLDVVEGIAHRVAVLDQGRLVALGTRDELRSRAGGGDRLEEVFRRLTSASDPKARAEAILGPERR